jgi:F-type H+-transporting ATPase subunit c
MILQASKLIGAGLSTIALAGVGTGIGTVFSALISSVARNPHLMKQLFAYAILGFAFTEAVALFALMMAFFNFIHILIFVKIEFYQKFGL